MLGSVLSNILLVLGCSFVAGTPHLLYLSGYRLVSIGGLVRRESNFAVTAAQA